MAIEYGFELDGVDVEQTAELMASAEPAADAAGFQRPGVELASGVLVSVSASTPLPFPDPIEQELGVTPTVHVLFRFDKETDVVDQRADMVRLVSAVLRGSQGDAVLTYQGEVVWLLRKGGRLTISDRDDFWIPPIRALLAQPYERASLPVL